MAIVFDNSRWPISHQKFPAKWNDDASRDLRASLADVMQRNSLYGAVLDFEGIPRLNAAGRSCAA